MIERIVSGGQTGVDRAALDVAMELGIATGGWVPSGRRAEDGAIPERYVGLRQTRSRRYAERTELNVRDSDATLVFTDGALRGGTQLTHSLAAAMARPMLVVDMSASTVDQACRQVREWLARVQPTALNVAGPRASQAPDIGGYVVDVLRAALSTTGRDRARPRRRMPAAASSPVAPVLAGVVGPDRNRTASSVHSMDRIAHRRRATRLNTIPDRYRDLLERPIVVALATLMSDGTPQVQPVWCSYDGTHILVNTEKGRQKCRNMSRRPSATILAVDPDDDARWLEVRGVVVEETEEGAEAHIDELARLYMGVDRYPFHREGDVRVLFKIEPQRVATMESSMPGFDASA